MALFDIFDFLSDGGENLIRRWADGEALSRRDRAILNQKLDRLAQMDFDLARGTKLLAGPVHAHIYKLRVFGDVMLRPMLCKGPLRPDREYTVPVGAVERDGKLRPAHCKVTAAANRVLVGKYPHRRGPHEQF